MTVIIKAYLFGILNLKADVMRQQNIIVNLRSIRQTTFHTTSSKD